jgi:segregation and condensation protein B
VNRKRGKKQKVAVEAVPDDILAEGSGPVHRAETDAIATVEDVVTTADIATTDDVVTADDIVVTNGSIRYDDPASPEPDDGQHAADGGSLAPEHGRADAAPEPASAGRRRKRRRSDGRDGRRDSGRDVRTDAAGDDANTGEGGVASAANAVVSADDPSDDPSGASIEDREDAQDRPGANRPSRDAADGSDLEMAGDGDGDGDDSAMHASDVGDEAGLAMRASGLDDDDLDDRTDGPDDEDGEDGEDGAAEADAGEGPEEAEGSDDAIVFPTSAASMDAVQLKYLVEALIFASDRPLTVQRLRQLTRVGDVRRLEQALSDLSEDYRERGLILQQVSGGYQFRTRTQFSAWVQQLIAGRPVRLSRAQLETLAIIAYRQPITRPEIDDIRGVDSSQTLKLLIDRMLIRVLGKREEVGRPILYGTTKEFLDFFSLGDLRELPTLREYSELTAESRKVMSDRLGLAPDGSDGSDGTSGPGGSGGGDGSDGGGGPGGSDGGDGGDGDGGNGGGNGHGSGGGDGGAMPGFGQGSGSYDDATATASAVDLADAVAPFLSSVNGVEPLAE